MLKHIVLWTLHDSAEGNSKEENALLAKSRLEALKDTIPEIIDIEVGVNHVGQGSSVDLSLYSVFANEAALKRYQAHPEHQKILPFIGAITNGRHVIDYSI
ncbi:MAG: stress responsive protein [Cycloclasticus sp. symbiont of Bathymodiolus heckerae]|nr:MAG: stress responsive protein [Cycloclasticus sp. symbiont of Bathymodiolus heckerae]